MVTQPQTQGTDLPVQLGNLLDEVPTRLSHQTNSPVQEFEEMLNDEAARSFRQTIKPIQVSEKVSQFEIDVTWGEQLVNFALINFVEFVRQGGQDDDVALDFDNWANGLDIAEGFDTYEREVVPGLKHHATILHAIVNGWHKRAAAGEVEPDLPQALAKRVTQLDTLVKRLTRQITKKRNNEMIARLLIRIANHRPLSVSEKIRLSDAVRLNVKVKTMPSVYREDWYGDDGR